MEQTNDIQLRFDWQDHARRNGGVGTFLSWLLTHVLAEQRVNGKDLFEELTLATENFSDVRISFVINGIFVNAESFVRDLERVMDASVEREAYRLLEEKIAEFPNIYNAIDSARRHLIEKLAAAGVRIPEGD